MIFDDLTNGIIARLNTNAYFTQAPSILIVQEEPALDDGTPDDLRRQVNESLDTSGACVVVGEMDYSRDGDARDMYVVKQSIVFLENRVKNQDGSGRSARNLASVGHATLHGHVVPIADLDGGRIDPFTPIIVESLEYIGDTGGAIAREMTVSTRIAVDVLQYALANEDSFALVTETGAPLLHSPITP